MKNNVVKNVRNEPVVSITLSDHSQGTFAISCESARRVLDAALNTFGFSHIEKVGPCSPIEWSQSGRNSVEGVVSFHLTSALPLKYRNNPFFWKCVVASVAYY